jgi:hypothetical protein
MKEFKKVFVVFVLCVVAVGGISAQQKAYIKPTFGFGFGTISGDGISDGGAAFSFDADFVTSQGLTLGFQNLFAFSDFGINLHPFGVGYTYQINDTWSVGGKLMVVPTSVVDGGIGFDVNGTYWLNETLGVTGIADLYFSMGDESGTAFSMRVGLSTKF